MELVIKAATTGIIVALVLIAARRLGHRSAGILAGLPLTTLPALGWVAVDGGADLASRTAIGSVFGCILVPMFAIAYERAARRWSPAASVLAGLAAVGLVTAFGCRMPTALWQAIALFAVGSGAALHFLQAREPASRPVRHTPASGSSIAVSAGVVALASTLVAVLASETNPQLAGLVAGVPTLGLVTVVTRHSRSGPESVAPFLRGYVISASGKVAFGAVFARFAVSVGSTLAMVCAVLAGLALCVVALRFEGRLR